MGGRAGLRALGGPQAPQRGEWEFAARGPAGRRFPWGDEPPDGDRLNLADQSAPWSFESHLRRSGAKAAFRDGFAYTSPVGTYPAGASASGCLDMAGNVFEWVQDRYTTSYRDAPRDGSAQEEGELDRRVARGGCWGAPARVCLSANRSAVPPGRRFTFVGFRLARSAD